MHPSRFLFILPALALLSGCAAVPRIASQFPTTDRRLTAPVPAGYSRVVVYNSSTGMLSGVDHTDRMEVEIDGRALGSLDRNEYVQVFLTPGRHDVSLRHRDMVWYETEHPVLIDRPTRWLSVRSDPDGNLFDARDEPPADFAKKYHPVGER